MDTRTLMLELSSGKVDSINILSNEGDIYTAEVVVQGREYTLEVEDSHTPLVFHSYIEAKRQLAAYAVPLQLKASYVYDEMVSREPSRH